MTDSILKVIFFLEVKNLLVNTDMNQYQRLKNTTQKMFIGELSTNTKLESLE